jgi:hypothetical protein
MVISVKKESEKTLSLSKITKEILEYCDTEAALKNLQDEWSKFKDFKSLLKVARYYSPRYYNIKSAGTFGLNEELSFLDKMRKMLSSDGVSKWNDLSKKDKTNYNFLLNEVRDNFDVITRELSRKNLSYDVVQNKFVVSYEEQNDYNNQSVNFIYSKNGCADTINTNLLVLFDLSRISTMQSSYNTKLEFIWLKYLLDLASLEDFLKEVLQQLKREAKSKLKNFTTTLEYNQNYPSGLFSKQLVEKYIKETFITDGHRSYVKVSDRNILNCILKNNTDDYFNNILKENLRVSKLSAKQLVYLTIYQPDLYIDGYSNLDDTNKKIMIRNILLDWSNDKIFISRDLDIDLIKNYFTDEEIFIAFKSRTKEILQAILSESIYPHFGENNLIKLENGNYICIENSTETTTLDFSQSQLSELKSEFIPILEKIQDVILVDYKDGTNKYILESVINPNLTKKEKIKSLIGNLGYGDFLRWIFKLLDWFPSRFILIDKVNNFDLADKNNPEIIQDDDLYRFRKDVTSLLMFKDILEFAGADYVSCCFVERRPTSSSEYVVDSDEAFRQILKLSLGKDIEFLEYACENLNKDVYDKRNLNITGLNSPRIKF